MKKRNVLVGAVLTTAALATAIWQTSVLNTEPDIPSPAPTQPCGFTWAYKDAPELTETFNTAVKVLNPEASAHAQYFGEDCVYADGSTTFGAMETDFYVRLPVEDISQQGEFGNWITQVMNIVTGIPREDLQGPKYGFVEFTFEVNAAERIALRVPIQQYLDTAKGKSGVELFLLFYNQP